MPYKDMHDKTTMLIRKETRDKIDSVGKRHEPFHAIVERIVNYFLENNHYADSEGNENK